MPMTHAAVTKGSGNVFRDLGFFEEESVELILKRSLLRDLQETIKDHGWKQVAEFSIEHLVNFLSLLGEDVEVTVRKTPHGQQHSTVRDQNTKKLDKIAS